MISFFLSNFTLFIFAFHFAYIHTIGSIPKRNNHFKNTVGRHDAKIVWYTQFHSITLDQIILYDYCPIILQNDCINV